MLESDDRSLGHGVQITLLAIMSMAVASGCATYSEEGQAWAQAKNRDTIKSYEQFLRDYPSSALRPQAEARLAASVEKLNAAFPNEWHEVQQLAFSRTNISWLIEHLTIQGKPYEDVFSMPILRFCDAYSTRPEAAIKLKEFFAYLTEITPPSSGCTTSSVLGQFWPKEFASGTDYIVNGERHRKFVYPNVDVMAVVVGSRGNRMIEVYHDGKFWSLYERGSKGLVPLSSLGKL